MQINSHNSLPLITGNDHQRLRQSSRQQKADEEHEHSSKRIAAPLDGQIVQSQFSASELTARSVRPAVNAQPLFNQQLTQRGEQAQRAYQNIELAGEVELTNRLDVLA